MRASFAFRILWSILLGALLLSVGCEPNYSEATAYAARPLYRPNPESRPTMTQAEARRVLKLTWKFPHQVTSFFFRAESAPSDAAPTDKVVFIEFRKIREIMENAPPNWAGRVVWVDGWRPYFPGNGAKEARDCTDAWHAMRYYASHSLLSNDPASFAEFQARVRAWRSLPEKPSLPEEARRYKARAEDAVRNKEFDTAVYCYERALEIYPMWPEGYFNAALLCGEIGFCSEAVGHMKRYLELCPDAPDAQAARNKIYVWEGRMSSREDPILHLPLFP